MENVTASNKQVKKAVQSLLEFHKLHNKESTSLFRDAPDNINIQFTLVKVQKTANSKLIKIGVPNKVTTDNTSVCLFVKDVDKKDRDYEVTVRHYQQLFEEKGVLGITQIVPLKQLKLEYGPHEAKRQLSQSYDLFLADSRILGLLPRSLGKNFYRKKKVPIQVNLEATDLKNEFHHKTFRCARCIMACAGSSNTMTVAHTSMEAQGIVDNVVAVLEVLGEKIPGGVRNLKTVHIKTPQSPALPLFVSLESPENIVLPALHKPREEIEAEDVTTIVHGKVKVTPGGSVLVMNTPMLKRMAQKNKQTVVSEDTNSSKKVKIDVDQESKNQKVLESKSDALSQKVTDVTKKKSIKKEKSAEKKRTRLSTRKPKLK